MNWSAAEIAITYKINNCEQKGKYQLVVAKESWKSFKTKLKAVTRKTNPMSLEERFERLNQIQRGWINYFKLASIQQKLMKLDGWLRIGAQRKSRTQ